MGPVLRPAIAEIVRIGLGLHLADDRQFDLVGEAGAIGVTAVLSESGHGAQLQMQGRHGTADYRLDPITETVWKASFLGVFAGLGGIVTFDADGGGFSLTAGRMKAIRFVRTR